MKVKGFALLENHNTAIDHALNLACKPIHCNNRTEINGQILSCNRQLSSIKIHPVAWPLSIDLTLGWLTQFPLASWQTGNLPGCGKAPAMPPPTPKRLPWSWCVGCTAACLGGPWPGTFPQPDTSPGCSQLGRPHSGNHPSCPRLYKQPQFGIKEA